VHFNLQPALRLHARATLAWLSDDLVLGGPELCIGGRPVSLMETAMSAVRAPGDSVENQAGPAGLPRPQTALLIVGEERSNGKIADALALEDYQVRRATDPRALRAACAPGGVDLIVFGKVAQQGSRLDALHELRAGRLAPDLDSSTRVLWISAVRDTSDVLRAFAAGADDVIRAPFVHAELLARVCALMRRRPVDDSAAIRYGKLRIDTTACQVTFADTPIHLRRQEYALLVHLAQDPTRVYSKDELLREVWGFRSRGTTRTVTTHVSRLRQALALAGAEGWVSSVWGVGYRLAPRMHGRLRVLPGGRRA
jgi:DNA-binding response OmpR family regulator